MDPSLKLVFDEILRKFDEIEARMERRFSRTMAALEQRGDADELRDGDLEQINAEKGAAKTEQFVVVDNWAGLFDEIPATCHEPVPVPDDLPFAAVDDVAFDSELHSTDLDRLSLLPDELLRNIVSRLPVKDAGRMVVLSRRWRPLWRAARFTSPMRSDSVSMELLPTKARLTVVREKERIEAQPFSLEVQFAPEIVDRLVGDLSALRATRLRRPRHHPPRPPWRCHLRRAPPPRGPRRAPPRPPRFRQPRRAPPCPPWLRPSPSTRTRRGPCRSPSAPSSGPYATGSRSTASRSTPKAAASAFREFATFSFPNSSHSSCAADDGVVDPIDPGPKFALQNSFRIHCGAEVADLFRWLGFIGAADIIIYRGFQLPGSGDALTCFLHGGALHRCAFVFPTAAFEASSTSSTRKAAASSYHVWLGIFPVRSEASRGTPCYTTDADHLGKADFPGEITPHSWCSTPGPNHGKFVPTDVFATLAPSSTSAGEPVYYIQPLGFCVQPLDLRSGKPRPLFCFGSNECRTLLDRGSRAGEHVVLFKLLINAEAIASPSVSGGNTSKTLLRKVASFLFGHDCVPALKPTQEGCDKLAMLLGARAPAAPWQMAYLQTALDVMGFGAAGIRPCVSLGADQFDGRSPEYKRRLGCYFELFYLAGTKSAIHGSAKIEHTDGSVVLGLFISILSVAWAGLFERYCRGYAARHGFLALFNMPVPDPSALMPSRLSCYIDAVTKHASLWLVAAMGEDAERIVAQLKGTLDFVGPDSHIRSGPVEHAFASFGMLLLQQSLVTWTMPMLRDGEQHQLLSRVVNCTSYCSRRLIIGFRDMQELWTNRLLGVDVTIPWAGMGDLSLVPKAHGWNVSALRREHGPGACVLPGAAHSTTSAWKITAAA